MPAVALNDILSLQVICNNVEQTSFNTFHYIITATAPPAPFVSDVGVAFDTLMAPLFKACMSANSVYEGVRAQKIAPLPVTAQALISAHTGAGTAGGNDLPRQTAGLISWKTDLAGRGFRGRTYVPFPSSTFLTPGGHTTAGYQTAVLAIANAAIGFTAVAAGGGSCGLLLGVYHRKTLTITPIVSPARVRLFWATDRRRGDFGRPNVSPI